jgi:hypothetical protein
VKRLIRTSNGWLETDVNHLGIRRLGTSVRATFFGDGGWALEAETLEAIRVTALVFALAAIGGLRSSSRLSSSSGS